MSRRKHQGGHVNHERWMVSYADFVTLLFAFFVVMFAASQVDKRKMGKIALAVQVAFQQLGIFTTSNTHVELSTSDPMPFSKVQMVENAIRTASLGRVVERPQGSTGAGASAANQPDLQDALERALAPEIRRRDISIVRRREGLVVSLREIGFFESGSATLKQAAAGTVSKIAAILGPRQDMMRIEGHTDNVPIHNAAFNSNWELSTARATDLVAVFIDRYHIVPARLSAAGYAEYHPVASNDTPDGRALNRRVDIVIVGPLSQEPLLRIGSPAALPASP